MKKMLALLIGMVLLSTSAFAVTNSSVNLAIQNNADGYQVAGGTTSRLFTITGAAITLNATQAVVGANTYTWPSATDTLVGRASTDTLTNKTLTSSTDVLGGVTMTLGSDATGDMYYRAAGGALTRMAVGTSSQVIVGGTTPSFGSVPASGLTGTVPLANGGTAANLTAPGADNLFGWDNTDGATKFITIGSGLTYTHSSHTLSASATGYSPLPMTVVSGTTQAAAVNNGYASNNAGLVTITMPSTAAVGDVVVIDGLGAGGWKLAQNASQLIHFGSTVTTTGTSGFLSSNNQYDSVSIRCLVANTTWVVESSQGNITVN